MQTTANNYITLRGSSDLRQVNAINGGTQHVALPRLAAWGLGSQVVGLLDTV